MESFDAEIYDNTIENCKYGIRLSVGSADNDIHDNTFDSSSTCEEKLHVKLPFRRLQHVLWEGTLKSPNPMRYECSSVSSPAFWGVSPAIRGNGGYHDDAFCLGSAPCFVHCP